MPIYTKTGDQGITSLYGGKRLLKSDLQVEAYGTVDELTSFIGLVVSKIKNKKEKGFLIELQKDLYKLMAYLSGKEIDLSFLNKRIKDFENKIDQLDKKLPTLSKFIISGGTEVSSWFHILRTVCRRAERSVIKYFQEKKNLELGIWNLEIIAYLNRLSDLFFILARFYNRGKEVVV